MRETNESVLWELVQQARIIKRSSGQGGGQLICKNIFTSYVGLCVFLTYE